MEQPQFKVQVFCMTFNQAPYVIETLNGFCMQQTMFPFICTIFDDCSTDGEHEVIRQFLQDNFDLDDKSVVRNEETDDYVMTFARHKTNEKCFFAAYYLKYNHYSIGKNNRKNEYCKGFVEQTPYVALCEGDDYWTDPFKLKKQVEYLDLHPECGLVYTNAIVLNQATGEFSRVSFPHQSDFENLLLGSTIITLTTCFRKVLFCSYYREIRIDPSWLMGDLPLWLYISEKGPIKYLSDNTGVYRVLENSASHSADINKSISFCLSSYQIRMFYAKYYNCQHLRKQICITHINELIKISVSFDRSLSSYIAKMALNNRIVSPIIWMKVLLYSTSVGRRFHKRKYTK